MKDEQDECVALRQMLADHKEQAITVNCLSRLMGLRVVPEC
jgi:hypothetical protein